MIPYGASGYDYVYQYKDHLGNIRLSYSDSNGDGVVDISELIEESNYYPFGLQHRGYNNIVNGTENKFLTYNGVEFEESLDLNMYEMDFRQYDPAIARFNALDPVTHHSFSPYNAFDNNPVFWADPSGADAVYNWGTGRYEDEKGNEISWENVQKEYGIGNASNGQEDCCADPPSVGGIVGATIRGWWSSIFGGGRDDVETLAESGLVEKAQKLEKQIDETVAHRTEQLEEYEEAISIVPGMSFVEGAQQAGEGRYGAAGLSMALFITEMMPGEGTVSKAGTNLINESVKRAKQWLGKDYKVIINKAGDKIFISKDRLRKIRFDVKNPHGDKPHIHLEVFENGKWKDAIRGMHRIYPKQ